MFFIDSTLRTNAYCSRMKTPVRSGRYTGAAAVYTYRADALPQERAAVAEFASEFDALGYGYVQLEDGKIGLSKFRPTCLPTPLGSCLPRLSPRLQKAAALRALSAIALYEHALYTASCKAAMKAGLQRRWLRLA